MAISDWPIDERPREKLISRGSDALSDAELLAIFLRTGTAKRTALDLARDLLRDFGSLRCILNSSAQQFCRHRGLGIAKYAQLQATLEIARRHLAEELEREDCLVSPTHTRNYLHARLRDYEHEVFACLIGAQWIK